MGSRVFVYVDGFNFYNGAVKIKPQYKWLDLVALSKRLMVGYDVLKVKYFTAQVNGFESRLRQNIYWDALRSYHPDMLKIVEGYFVREKKKRPIARYQFDNGKKSVSGDRVWVVNTSEKCTDVNLAVHLIHDAWKDVYDTALIVSNDSDLREALILAKNECGKEVVIANPFLWDPKGASSELAKLNLPKRRIRETQLRACQLPDTIPGTSISKPPEWN